MSIPDPRALLANLASQLIGALALNALRIDLARGTVAKRRRWFAPAVIAFGGAYTRLMRLPIRVLPERAWIARERRLYRALYGEQVEAARGGWLIVRHHGTALSALLVQRERSAEARRAWLCAAMRELRRVHGIRVPVRGHEEPFSHGDAGARNIAFCPRTGRPHWFDFEIAHDHRLDPRARQADDIRALLFSALSLLPPGECDEAARAALAAYDDAGVRAALASRIAAGSLRTDTYHLAQLRISLRRHNELCALVARALAATGCAPAARQREAA